MEKSIDILHSLLSSLTDKVLKLANQVGSMQATCTLQHKFDLCSLVTIIKFLLDNIKKTLTAQLNTNNVSEDIHSQILLMIQLQKVLISNLTTKILNLEQLIKNYKKDIEKLLSIIQLQESTNNTFRIRIKDLLLYKLSLKHKSDKKLLRNYNFKSQIAIYILGAILVSLITLLCNVVWVQITEYRVSEDNDRQIRRNYRQPESRYNKDNK